MIYFQYLWWTLPLDMQDTEYGLANKNDIDYQRWTYKLTDEKIMLTHYIIEE